MTLYYSEKTLQDEMISHLRKEYRRSEYDSNHFRIPRAGTIQSDLLLKYFDCAVTKEHDLYKVEITLPIDLEDRVPFWFVQTADGEIWVDPNSGLRGLNMYRQEVFITKFQLYVNEKAAHGLEETKDFSTDRILVNEFRQIKHALADGQEEPIEIFRNYYNYGIIENPRTQAGKFLSLIIKREA